MGVCYYINIDNNGFFIGKSSYGCRFSTNIFGWYDLLVFLDEIQGKGSYFPDRMVLYAMCGVAKNINDKWDEKGLTKKQVKSVFERTIKRVEQANGKIVDEDGEILTSKYLLERIFDDSSSLNYSEYLPSKSTMFNDDRYTHSKIFKYIIKQVHKCKGCYLSKDRVTYEICEDCSIDVFKKYYICDKKPDDPEYYRTKYNISFQFYSHIIAGVKCEITHNFC